MMWNRPFTAVSDFAIPLRRCLALFAVPLAACADPAPQNTAVVRDSAGVRIVENSTPIWHEGEAWRLSPEPIVDIGGGDTEDDQLFRVTGAARLSNGQIVIANGGSVELKFYASNGAHMFDAGGAGGGPGELQSVGWFQRLGGRYRRQTHHP